ncbi:MAG TPA: type II toxin-antitoxin system HicA family toxin [Patescibacteria group bacterium]|jgi:predicted RNA binding protein YcfA (HicA-like mRNA interferase family)|nr:type II toxin-antitoxin system HicA family toxin [Patescibacteria group bacterium]
MSHIGSFTAREVMGYVSEYGWHPDGVGKHPNYVHPDSDNKIQIPFHGKQTLKLQTVRSIFNQAGMLPVFRLMQKGVPWKQIRKKVPAIEKPQP